MIQLSSLINDGGGRGTFCTDLPCWQLQEVLYKQIYQLQIGE